MTDTGRVLPPCDRRADAIGAGESQHAVPHVHDSRCQPEVAGRPHPQWGGEYVGQAVSVLLGVLDTGAEVHVVGTLVSIEPEGDFVIDTAEGRRFCWPALEMTPARVLPTTEDSDD